MSDAGTFCGDGIEILNADDLAALDQIEQQATPIVVPQAQPTEAPTTAATNSRRESRNPATGATRGGGTTTEPIQKKRKLRDVTAGQGTAQVTVDSGRGSKGENDKKPTRKNAKAEKEESSVSISLSSPLR